MEYLVALAFVVIIGSLAAALFFMLRGNGGDPKTKSRNMARALTVRIGFSVLLFIGILLAWKFGLIHPTGLPAGK